MPCDLKGREEDPQWDVICCIVDYRLKEELLRRARVLMPLQHNDKEIRIYQDLSSITLQHRREMRPLLEVLRTKGITYCWKFPFGLAASSHDRSTLLRVPEDLHHFCETLDIPLTEVPEWYVEFRSPAPNTHLSRSEPMET